MSKETAIHLVLEIRYMNFTDGPRAWWKDDGRLDALLIPIQEKVFLDIPCQLQIESKKKRLRLDRLKDIAPEIVNAGKGSYEITGDDPKRPRRLNPFVGEASFEVELEVWIGPDDLQPTPNDFTTMAVELNNACLKHGTIGPTFTLRWYDPDYPRPLPPRFDRAWPPGAVAYYLSAAYYLNQSADKQATFPLLRDAPLPQGLIRQQYDDLLVIQAAEKFEPRKEFELNLYKLELWIGKTLDLKLARDYQANGDKRSTIWSKEIVKPFSFYDDSTRTGYKVVAENRDDELDAETWKELEEILPLRSLPDGRPVNATRVIFVGREAALLHLPRIYELGGSRVLYLSEDGDLWNPAPPGQWIRTDWDEV